MPSNRIELAKNIWLAPTVLNWHFTRSSGPGGQNVNKLNTKTTLEVQLDDLKDAIPDYAYQRLISTAGQYLATDKIIISADQSRSQLTNRRLCFAKLKELITTAMKRPRKRRPTKPTKASIERRITTKKKRGKIKQNRRKPTNKDN